MGILRYIINSVTSVNSSNTITNNEGYAIHSDGNTIVSIQYILEIIDGVFSNNILGTVTTAYCYWGNSSGPYHPSQNPSGSR